jgi:hypothetical protein
VALSSNSQINVSRSVLQPSYVLLVKTPQIRVTLSDVTSVLQIFQEFLNSFLINKQCFQLLQLPLQLASAVRPNYEAELVGEICLVGNCRWSQRGGRATGQVVLTSCKAGEDESGNKPGCFPGSNYNHDRPAPTPLAGTVRAVDNKPWRAGSNRRPVGQCTPRRPGSKKTESVNVAATGALEDLARP